MALVVSAAAFLTIVAVLYKLDGELQPELAYDLNVNTLIAIFSVMLRATLLFVMAEVIGQSKWLWLKPARSLRDLKYFHDAGQGAGGSSRFLFFSWKPILTIAGVFVIIASYVIGPFSQQAAKTYFCQKKVEGGTARIAVAEWYVYTRSPYMYNIQAAEIEAVIINGLIFDAADSTFKSMFTCTTGNCTFDATGGVSHTSIGFCSACNDVTSSLQTLDRSQEVLYQSQNDPKFNLTYSLKTANVWKAKVFDLRINCKSEETDPTDSPEETCTISIATLKNSWVCLQQ
ncbi:hypothetical protein CPLU01_07059 [Colletotrichum plurivorum]|uniref:Uncharacterized protein n=1 Tax=Colletotrichum plurivorum TaxID=2175906 RepID=A0A8H6NFN1_9PEZI|nr:hypothetical protein CPLU01_07059 [Colletotrichum plurivorum]